MTWEQKKTEYFYKWMYNLKHSYKKNKNPRNLDGIIDKFQQIFKKE